MAIVFWKPSEIEGMSATIHELFEDIVGQDEQTQKLSISPFFKKENQHKKIVFFSDIVPQSESIKPTLSLIRQVQEAFISALSPSSVQVFISTRHSSQLPLLNQFFPMLQSNFNTNYTFIAAPPAPLPRASFAQAIPLGFAPRPAYGPSPNPSICPIPQAKSIYWPEAMVDADLIIPINLFGSSSVFTIHSTIASMFYALPSSCQSLILVQANLRYRSQMLLEHLQPLVPKITLAALFDDKEEGYVSLANDFVSIDSFSSALAGFRALQVPLNRFAHQRRWGNGDIVKINLIGPSFRKPLKNLSQKNLFDFKSSLVCLESKCIQCNQCVLSCPFMAWKKTDCRSYLWNPAKCHYCGHCIDFCPSSAVQIISKGVAHGKNLSH
jgi:ferredoxin